MPFGFPLRRLQSPDDPAFAGLLALYEQSFPASERKQPETLRRMLAHDRYHFLLAAEAEEALGFAILRVLNCGDAALLEYLAVKSAQRGRGLGGRIALAAAHAVDAPPLTLLIEVESDRAEGEDKALRTRRKHFYRAHGALELEGLRWLMPAVSATPPPPMDLLVFGPRRESLSKEHLRRWLRSIYADVYEQFSDDVRIETMLEGLPEDIRLR